MAGHDTTCWTVIRGAAAGDRDDRDLFARRYEPVVRAYLSDDFPAELAFLGMASSPSFVREPEGNGVAERFIRTLKENLLWVRHFATVVELIEALQEFQRRYNEQWLIERHGYRSPAQVRRDLTARIPAVA